ncbi:hypothetical protein HDV06_004011 [Boothiomyces sp. JEL0866]|nr:hypothetical protein HDV06_004011 [Boothiomyces sp. JEL0866]
METKIPKIKSRLKRTDSTDSIRPSLIPKPFRRDTLSRNSSTSTLDQSETATEFTSNVESGPDQPLDSPDFRRANNQLAGSLIRVIDRSENLNPITSSFHISHSIKPSANTLPKSNSIQSSANSTTVKNHLTENDQDTITPMVTPVQNKRKLRHSSSMPILKPQHNPAISFSNMYKITEIEQTVKLPLITNTRVYIRKDKINQNQTLYLFNDLVLIHPPRILIPTNNLVLQENENLELNGIAIKFDSCKDQNDFIGTVSSLRNKWMKDYESKEIVHCHYETISTFLSKNKMQENPVELLMALAVEASLANTIDSEERKRKEIELFNMYVEHYQKLQDDKTCSFCKKEFKTCKAVREHERIHKGDKPYVCTVCNARFTQSSGLRTHSFTHTGTKPYKCTTCPAGFTTSSRLKEHVNSHLGIKNYKCSLCDKSFTQHCNMIAHQKTHQKIEQEFKCTECPNVYKNRTSLIRHRKKHSA